MNWLLTWTAVGAIAAVLAAVVSIVGAVWSWGARKDAVEAAATAKRHAVAAENTAAASSDMAGELRRLADQKMPSPLTLADGVLRNVSASAVTITSVVNVGEFGGGPVPIVVPLSLDVGKSCRIDLGQRYGDAARPGRLVLEVEGRATPVVLDVKTPGRAWFV